MSSQTLDASQYPINDNGEVTGAVSADGLAPQLVIFDLDGTLTDSAEGIVTSFLHALSHIGAPVPEGDLAAQIVGPPMDETFQTMGLGEHADAAFTAFRAEYGARGWAMNSLFDGIEPLLADLRAAGVRLAVATSKLEPTARRILAHFGLDQHFEVIAGACPDGSRKSKEEVLAPRTDPARAAARAGAHGRRPQPRRRRGGRTRHRHRGGRLGLRHRPISPTASARSASPTPRPCAELRRALGV